MADASGTVPYKLQPIDLFHYIPNLPLAIICAILFLFFFFYLTYRVKRSKSPRFLYILPITSLFEFLGYVIRLKVRTDITIATYAVMTLFLLLPPNALALVNYKCAGEIIRLSNAEPKHFFLRPRFVTWFFFASDIFAFVMQGAGGGLQGTGDPDLSNMGSKIAMIGLAVQLLFFGSFAVITVYLDRKPEYVYTIQGQDQPKKKLIHCLYITTALLYIRAIYRIIEFAGGYDGPVASAEWAFYVFDSLVLFLCFVFYSVLYIGNYLPKRDEDDQSSKGWRGALSTEDVALTNIEKGNTNNYPHRV
ncbi:Protein RTA1 [Choanephora cucurbitarum]|uniref:Protein RTA1 n=1 Tax=Choanephora cucurbitarum TaxID=101091 RepID=A0A1C7NFA5_9FUNG|nr:Protein RTA1 [Choanephora cucurbitarum]